MILRLKLACLSFEEDFEYVINLSTFFADCILLLCKRFILNDQTLKKIENTISFRFNLTKM